MLSLELSVLCVLSLYPYHVDVGLSGLQRIADVGVIEPREGGVIDVTPELCVVVAVPCGDGLNRNYECVD